MRTLVSHQSQGSATPGCHRGAQHQLPWLAGARGASGPGQPGPGRGAGPAVPEASPTAPPLAGLGASGAGVPGLREQHPRPPTALRPYGRSAEERGQGGTNTAEKQLSPGPEPPLPRRVPSRGRAAAARPERGAPSLGPSRGEGQAPGRERPPRPPARSPPGTPARPAGPAGAEGARRRPPTPGRCSPWWPWRCRRGLRCRSALPPPLPPSLRAAAARSLSRCVRPARRRRWAAQAAPPQRPRAPPPPGGRGAAQQPGWAGGS